MTIDELIAEGKKLQVTNIKIHSNTTKYHTWTNNCVTYFEQIKFSKDRRNQFMFYAANSKFEPMLGMLQSIKDNSESEEPVTNCDQSKELVANHDLRRLEVTKCNVKFLRQSTSRSFDIAICDIKT